MLQLPLSILRFGAGGFFAAHSRGVNVFGILVDSPSSTSGFNDKYVSISRGFLLDLVPFICTPIGILFIPSMCLGKIVKIFFFGY